MSRFIPQDLSSSDPHRNERPDASHAHMGLPSKEVEEFRQSELTIAQNVDLTKEFPVETEEGW